MATMAETLPLTRELTPHQRMEWMRKFLGNWALVGLGMTPNSAEQCVGVWPRAGLVRPPT